MPSVTIHYDGWLMLPERVRKVLGVGTGDQLEVSLEKGV